MLVSGILSSIQLKDRIFPKEIKKDNGKFRTKYKILVLFGCPSILSIDLIFFGTIWCMVLSGYSRKNSILKMAFQIE